MGAEPERRAAVKDREQIKQTFVGGHSFRCERMRRRVMNKAVDGRMESTNQHTGPPRFEDRAGKVCRSREKKAREHRRGASRMGVRAAQGSRIYRAAAHLQDSSPHRPFQTALKNISRNANPSLVG